MQDGRTAGRRTDRSGAWAWALGGGGGETDKVVKIVVQGSSST